MEKYVVLEGFDGCGKTTLQQRLCEDLKAVKLATYRKPHRYQDIRDYTSWITQCPFNVIIDRHPYISELIYGSVLNRAPLVTQQETEYWAGSVLIVHCRPSEPKLYSQPQMEGVIENASRLMLQYDYLFEVLPHITYDWTNYDHIRNTIASYFSSSAGVNAEDRGERG